MGTLDQVIKSLGKHNQVNGIPRCRFVSRRFQPIKSQNNIMANLDARAHEMAMEVRVFHVVKCRRGDQVRSKTLAAFGRGPIRRRRQSRCGIIVAGVCDILLL